MPPAQLKATTMAPQSRILLRVEIGGDGEGDTARRVEDLMGRNPEKRLAFIQEHAAQVEDKDLDL